MTEHAKWVNFLQELIPLAKEFQSASLSLIREEKGRIETTSCAGDTTGRRQVSVVDPPGRRNLIIDMSRIAVAGQFHVVPDHAQRDREAPRLFRGEHAAFPDSSDTSSSLPARTAVRTPASDQAPNAWR